MTEEIEKCYINDILLLIENTCSENQELENKSYKDDKVFVSTTTVDDVIGNEFGNHIRDDSITQYEMSTTSNNTKKKLSLSEPCNSNISYTNNGEAEDGTNAAQSVHSIKNNFDNALFFCEHCQAYYEDYCSKCGVLIHILNRNVHSNTDYNAREEMPKHILEIRELFEEIGIFAVKVIPKGVKFGPFSGLSSAEGGWKLKGGKFLVKEDKSKYLNWMQFINPARNIYEQNLLAFQYENNLYYRSTREIQVDEELLVHFGGKYEDSLNSNVEMVFVPTVEESTEDVFACIFCSLGFSSRLYLTKHKNICNRKISEHFSSKELTRCLFCKVYLEEEEYLKHHAAYCRERNERKCVPLVSDNQKVKVNCRKIRQFQLYKCMKCKYTTKYRADFKKHANMHYIVKTHRCRICYKRFRTRDSLRTHVQNVHINGRGKKTAQKYCASDGNLNADIEASRSTVDHSSRDEMKQFKSRHGYNNQSLTHMETKHLEAFNFKCMYCDHRTNEPLAMEVHIKTKHLNYECHSCEFRTSGKGYLKHHIETRHVEEFDFKCESCDFKTNLKPVLENHTRTKHLGEFDFKCESCGFKTNWKSGLEKHIKTKHLGEYDFKCESCDFRTNEKRRLGIHVRSKHLDEFSYRCEKCEYRTNERKNFVIHVGTKHLVEFKYKCKSCEYQSNDKRNFRNHVNAKHLQEFKFNCVSCPYKTYNRTNFERHVRAKHPT